MFRSPTVRVSKPVSRAAIAAGVVAIGLTLVAGASGASPDAAAPLRLPAPLVDAPAGSAATQTAVLAGGCFWGLQGVFEHVRGVKQVIAGYAGGKGGTANYELVSTGTTGHAESVRVVFDPRQISYGALLRTYFSVATDPTQLDRQFPDEGSQYRGDIFYSDAIQRNVAVRYIAQLNGAKAFRHPIATRVDPLAGFFRAEGYHQNYLVRHPDAAYIATYDMPKVAALKVLFPAAYQGVPVTAL